ncbi:hypothetical protein BDF14DRAFT_1824283 [Spinellus fusiger]|nr:hypothetical protein BDF14DRAFT_1824283 [Spinellus fusiger]
MEGNRFHDPDTPPPLELVISPLGENNGSPQESIAQDILNSNQDKAETDRQNKKRHEIHINETHKTHETYTMDGTEEIDEKKDHLEEDICDNEEDMLENPQMKHALRIVESITHADRRRRPSKGGVLSNLLKLDLFDQGASGISSKLNASKPPMSYLRHASSGRTILKSLTPTGEWSQSTRTSLYMEDLNQAEIGNHAELAARRMCITAEIANILERQAFIVKLGKSLVRTGAPSHRIEGAMEKTSKRLEIDGSYIVLPGLMMVSFGDVETHTSETLLIKCSRSLDIHKLEKVNLVAHQIAKGELDVRQATELLDEINNSPPTWGQWWILLAYFFSSASISPLFFNGSWMDCWVSGLMGLAVGILTFVSERIPMLSNVFEIAVSVLVSVVTIALHPHVCFSSVSLSAIVVALPGYALTSAVMEMSAKNIVSGSIHLIHAIMYVLFLGFGLGYGASVWNLTHVEETIELAAVCNNPVSPYWYILLLPISGITIAVVFGAAKSQWIPFTMNAAVGFVVTFFLARVTHGDQNITSSVGAFALGLTGNLYGRLTNKLAFVPLIGGIIILVPGSLGVRGVIPFYDGTNGATGNNFALQIIGTALSITLGLFLASLCVYPTGRKRALYLGF